MSLITRLPVVEVHAALVCPYTGVAITAGTLRIQPTRNEQRAFALVGTERIPLDLTAAIPEDTTECRYFHSVYHGNDHGLTPLTFDSPPVIGLQTSTLLVIRPNGKCTVVHHRHSKVLCDGESELLVEIENSGHIDVEVAPSPDVHHAVRHRFTFERGELKVGPVPEEAKVA